MIGILVPGCISYELVRQVQELEVMTPGGKLIQGETTLGEVLSLYGAPDKLTEIGGRELLVYERAVSSHSGISIGIPLSDMIRIGAEISAYGRLARYDTLALFFTPDGILQHFVYEKGFDYPYLKTLIVEERAMHEELEIMVFDLKDLSRLNKSHTLSSLLKCWRERLRTILYRPISTPMRPRGGKRRPIIYQFILDYGIRYGEAYTTSRRLEGVAGLKNVQLFETFFVPACPG